MKRYFILLMIIIPQLGLAQSTPVVTIVDTERASTSECTDYQNQSVNPGVLNAILIAAVLGGYLDTAGAMDRSWHKTTVENDILSNPISSQLNKTYSEDMFNSGNFGPSKAKVFMNSIADQLGKNKVLNPTNGIQMG